MSIVVYMILTFLFLSYGMPVVLAVVCGAAQRQLAAQRLCPAAFALPAAAGMALLLAVCLVPQVSGWELVCIQALRRWAAGAFGGTLAGWAAGWASALPARQAV